MVYPKISETFCKRAPSILLLVNIILTVTWTQGEASLASGSSSTIKEGSASSTGNVDKLSPSLLSSYSSGEHSKLSKRSVSIPEEVLNRWNLVNPSSSSGFVGSNSPASSSSSSSSSDNSPSSPFTDEYETDLDSSLPLSPSDSEFIKRDDSRYAFGLGKRGSADTRYSFGIGKRIPELSRYLSGSKRLPNRFQFGLGKKSRYSFGLGKRDLYEYIKRRYNFGIGKRAASQRYAFGLGK